jgi:hypothetical protein
VCGLELAKERGVWTGISQGERCVDWNLKDSQGERCVDWNLKDSQGERCVDWK